MIALLLSKDAERLSFKLRPNPAIKRPMANPASDRLLIGP